MARHANDPRVPVRRLRHHRLLGRSRFGRLRALCVRSERAKRADAVALLDDRSGHAVLQLRAPIVVIGVRSTGLGDIFESE